MKKNKQKDNYILIIIAISLLVLSGLMIFWFSNFESNLKTQSAKIIGKASLIIDFGNSEKRAFEGSIVEKETLADVLNQVAKAGKFSYKLDEKNNLAAIDNFKNDKNKFWRWYINNQKVDKPTNEIILKPGDKILMKYE